MIETHKAKRVEIIIEAPLLERLERALIEAGATGYTVLPVFGGHGRSGPWSREGQVSGAEGMAAVVCISRPERVEALLEAAHAVLARHIGVVAISECDVVRKERF